MVGFYLDRVRLRLIDKPRKSPKVMSLTTEQLPRETMQAIIPKKV